MIYDFAGFLAPVLNAPEINQVDAGLVVPIIFGLAGDRGMGVLAGEPTTAPATCCGRRETVDWTLPSSWSGLRLLSGTYVYAFRTQASWRNTLAARTAASAAR